MGARQHILENLKKSFLKEIKGLSEDGDANEAVANLLLKLGKTISAKKISQQAAAVEEQAQPEEQVQPVSLPRTAPAFAPTPRAGARVGPMLPSSDSVGVCAG